MKKGLIAVVLVVAGLVAYNLVTTGEFSLIPTLSTSEDERAVADLERRFGEIKKRFSQAHRTAAVSGLDTTSDAEAARIGVRQIEKELKKLRERLTSGRAARKADALADALREFSHGLG